MISYIIELFSKPNYKLTVADEFVLALFIIFCMLILLGIILLIWCIHDKLKNYRNFKKEIKRQQKKNAEQIYYTLKNNLEEMNIERTNRN